MNSNVNMNLQKNDPREYRVSDIFNKELTEIIRIAIVLRES